MTPDTPISVVLLAARPSLRPPAVLASAVERGAVRDVVPAVGSFDGVATAFGEAVRRCASDLIYPLTPDAEPPDRLWPALAAAANAHPEACAFALGVAGLPRD